MIRNPLCIRLPGFDPTWLLDRLERPTKYLFHPLFLFLYAALVLSASAHLFLRLEEILERLPNIYDFFNIYTVTWLVVSFALLRCLHELGHALTCRHFGAACQEIGVMFLFFTPCLYCNVTDSWMLPNKWQRAAIASAGMIVEIVLAAIFFWVWWFTTPGLLNQISLSIAMIGSVATIVFNANPLLKYDGYFILSDLTEVTDLARRSQSELKRVLRKLLLEPEVTPVKSANESPKWLLVYAVSSLAYRTLMVTSILLFMYTIARHYDLHQILITLLFAYLILAIVRSMDRIKDFILFLQSRRRFSRARWTILIACFAALFFAFAPLPYHANCPVVIQGSNTQTVYANVRGILREVYVRPGELVTLGQALARIENTQLTYRYAEVANHLTLQKDRLQELQRWRAQGVAETSSELARAEEDLRRGEDLLQELRSRVDRLTLRAERSGVVLKAATRNRREDDVDVLPLWTGSLLDKSNIGCFVEIGEVICHITDKNKIQAHALVDEYDAQLMTNGDLSQVQLDSLPALLHAGHLMDIGQQRLDTVSQSFASRAGGEVPTYLKANGQETTFEGVYHATLSLDGEKLLPRIGQRGSARVYVGYHSLAWRVWRFVTLTLDSGK